MLAFPRGLMAWPSTPGPDALVELVALCDQDPRSDPGNPAFDPGRAGTRPDRHRAGGHVACEVVRGSRDLGQPEQLAADVVDEPLVEHPDAARIGRVREPVAVLACPAHLGVKVLVQVAQQIRVGRGLLEGVDRSLDAGVEFAFGGDPDRLGHCCRSLHRDEEELRLSLEPPQVPKVAAVDAFERRCQVGMSVLGANRSSCSSFSIWSRSARTA